jgi:hypothetical protein
MKRAMIGSILLIGSFFFSGYGLALAAHRQPFVNHATPAYCYGCHSLPAGVVYSRCAHYQIKFVYGGYYYRPMDIPSIKSTDLQNSTVRKTTGNTGLREIMILQKAQEGDANGLGRASNLRKVVHSNEVF